MKYNLIIIIIFWATHLALEVEEIREILMLQFENFHLVLLLISSTMFVIG